ncbi:phosphonate ABC transporter, permease protein PhnE [Citricoccus sp. SGAir0253]|uniref:phosphonate ABC transporter, permease protein PhnE n=1 Tax=Citricoccus sp. SGAir0253 TaxID=2567881 RepID=UPI0010CD3B67|nr:phosphonate ABC transporter, permease protein PhnE [Citricoccus sp. SGAir0253]QCU78224.1 phosphonate ABC transporter, permease protein PhnE [Citricoccus sp. SGAir0253]
MTVTAPHPPSVQLPSRPTPLAGTVAAGLVLIGLVAAGIWSVNSLGIDLATIVQSLDNAVAFTQRMFPLDFPPLGETLGLIFETLAIVFLATLLSVVLSIPVALAAANATTRGKVSQGTARTLIVLARAIPDLVLAIVFLRMFGLGATAGILAMGIHSVGMVAKLYADAIEELDDGPRESVEAAGGSRGQQITASIPQVLMPQLVATALHRFDINLRTSVLLGYVGVGGIGLAIADALRTLNYQRGMALALLVLGLCIGIELLSGAIRAAIMKGSGGSVVGGTWADRLFNRGAADAPGAVRLTPPWTGARTQRFLAGVVILVLLLASLWQVEMSLAVLWQGLLDLPETLGLFFPPATGGALDALVQQLLVTIQIALAATFLGAVLALPIGVLAANNVVANRAVRTTFRVFIVVVRGIPELILAIIFVVISGLGGVAGTLALAVGAVGLLSKLVADSLEETDTAVQDAMRTAGATEVQVFFAATVRQAAPAFVAHTLYLLDSNIRAATLLGVVGAGGIGFLLLNASRVNQFEVVTMILILMVAVVLAVEALSMWLRKTVR